MFEHAVILAGGDGTRMRPITKYIPKALIEVGGQPVVYHNIESFQRQGVENIYATYNYLSPVLFNSLNLVVDAFINTTNQDDAYFLFNTFIKHLHAPVLVVPCNVMIEIDLKQIFNDYIRFNSPAIMMVGVRPVEGVASDYIHYNDFGVINSLSRDEISPLYASGMQVINPAKLQRMAKNDNNFNEVWRSMYASNEFKISSMHPISWMAYDDIKQIL